MYTNKCIAPLVITVHGFIEWCAVIRVSGAKSTDYFLNELNRARGGCMNVLVLEEGSISRNYSRLTSEAINAIQNLSAAEYLPLYVQVPELLGVGVDDFAAHSRRTWPPGGDGGRVVKPRARR